MDHHHDHRDRHDHDEGPAHDRPPLLTRRRALQVLGGAGLGAGLLAVAGCGSSSPSGTASAPTGGATPGPAGATSTSTIVGAGTTAASGAACSEIPEETAGPYPGDGSNGPDVLGEDGVVRSDITTSFGSLSGTAAGVPLTIRLRVLDVASGCTPKQGAAVYVWHCDAEGRYSLYSSGATGQNYLRGVQEVDADGWVTFESIVPGCYEGRWPHVHLRVYDSLPAADVGDEVATSQLALPEDVCDAVYATDGYQRSASNLGRVSLQGDMVFRDSWPAELASVTGDAASGYVAQLDVPV
jgi:protocatechuate 3,4-dioxygenase beta subunit